MRKGGAGRGRIISIVGDLGEPAPQIFIEFPQPRLVGPHPIRSTCVFLPGNSYAENWSLFGDDDPNEHNRVALYK